MEKRPTLPTKTSLFWEFFKISALTIGGGYAMIPVIESALERRGWMATKDFYELFSLAQSVPGPLAINTALVVGKTLKGSGGGAAAFLGVLIPPFFSIIIVAELFSMMSSSPYVQGFFDGSYGTVLGLVAATLVKMLRHKKWAIPEIVLAVLAAAGFYFFRGLALPIFAGAVVAAYGGNKLWKR